MHLKYLQTKLIITGVGVWLSATEHPPTLCFALANNLCYNTEPISHAQNV